MKHFLWFLTPTDLSSIQFISIIIIMFDINVSKSSCDEVDADFVKLSKLTNEHILH